jgi:hypothetical protein
MPTPDRWRWECPQCGANGHADTAEQVPALLRVHEGYACPATAADPSEYALRVARRADLTRRYPDYAPPWRLHEHPKGDRR